MGSVITRRARLWTTAVPAVLALVLVVTSCSSTTANAPVDPARSPAPGATVPEILDFTAPALGGGTVHGTSFAGKDLALWFWAPW